MLSCFGHIWLTNCIVSIKTSSLNLYFWKCCICEQLSSCLLLWALTLPKWESCLKQRELCGDSLFFLRQSFFMHPFLPRQAPVLWLTSFVDAKWCYAACCEWNVTEWNERIFLGALCMKDHFLELFKEWTSPWKSDPIEAQTELFQKWCFLLSLLPVPIFS